MAVPTLVQYVETMSNQDQAAGQDFKVPLPNATLANNCLILHIVFKYSASRTLTITDNVGGQTYTSYSAADDTTAGLSQRLYYALNVAAGVTWLNFRFDTAVMSFCVTISEWYNIATSGAADGQTSNPTATGNDVSAGTFTPGTDGSLIYQATVMTGAITNLMQLDWCTGFAAGSGFTLLCANRPYSMVSQYYVQASHTSITPTVTLNGANLTDTTCPSLAIALKSAEAGTAPASTGIRIIGIVNAFISTVSTLDVDLPSRGDLIAVSCAYSTDEGSIADITDNNGGSYTHQTVPNNPPQCTWSKNAAPKNDMVLSIGLTGFLLTAPLKIYDIINAAASPWDTDAYDDFDITGSPSNQVVDQPIITPTTSNGIVLMSVRLPTGPNDGSVGAGQVYDNTWFTGQDDQSPMESGDGHAHIYNADTSAISVGWHFPTTFDWNGFSAAWAFKGANEVPAYYGDPQPHVGVWPPSSIWRPGRV